MDAAFAVRYQRFNYFRTLHWRWDLAQCLVRECRLLKPFGDDRAFAAVQFLREQSDCSARRSRLRFQDRWQHLLSARQLGETKTSVRWEIQARILTGETDKLIADRFGIAPETVGWFESLFFHTRDRLRAYDWVASVIGLGLRYGVEADDIDKSWMSFGFFGGSLVLDAVIAASIRYGLVRDHPVCERTDPRAFETHLLESAHLAVRAMMLPAELPLARLVELNACASAARAAGEAPNAAPTGASGFGPSVKDIELRQPEFSSATSKAVA